MTNLIAKLKISVERKYVYPFFKVVDANNSGGIEYEEFEAYILNDQQWTASTNEWRLDSFATQDTIVHWAA